MKNMISCQKENEYSMKRNGGTFRFYNLEISTQFAVFFVAIFFIPMTVMGVFSYYSAQNQIKKSTEDLSLLTELQTNRLQTLINSHTASTLMQDAELMQKLSEVKKNFEALSTTIELNLVSFEESNTAHFLLPNRYMIPRAYKQDQPFSNRLNFLNEISTDQIVQKTVRDYRHQSVVLVAKNIPSSNIILVVKKDLSEIRAPLYNLLYLFLASSGLMLILLILLGLYSNQFIIKPLLDLTRVARRIQKGNYAETVEVIDQKNEIGTLSHAFKKMSEDLIEMNHTLASRVKQQTFRLRRALADARADQVKDEALLSSIGEGMIAINATGMILIANNAAETMLGIPVKKLKGRLFTDVFDLVTKEGVGVKSAEQPANLAMKQNKHVCTDQYLAQTKNKKTFPVEVSAAPVVVDGKTIGAIMILEDVTKEKEVDRMKSEYISIASHQLRGPLASLKWYGELMKKEAMPKLNKEQKVYMERITVCTKRMIDLVDDFLTMSRIEQGRMKNEPKRIQLESLLQLILDSVSVDVVKKNLHVSLEYKDKRKNVTHDPEMLREVFTNLISNAVKYASESGSVRVLVRPAGDLIRFEVINTGPGIPVSEQSKIFGKFFRAENVVKDGYEGTGLGLYTAKQLIEGMGGTIGFVSEEGKETTFWVEVPIIES